MKKLSILILIFTLFAVSLSAANNDGDKKEKKDKEKKERASWIKKDKDAPFKDRRLLFMIDLSPTISNLRGNDMVINDGRRLNISYGFGVEYKIDEKYSFVTGAKFVSRGGKYRNFDPITYQSTGTLPIEMPHKTIAKLKLRNLQIPILARANFSKNAKNVKPYAQAGFLFDIAMRQRATFKNKYDDNDFKIKNLNVEDEFKNFGISWTVGGGVIHAWSDKLDAYTGLSFARTFGNIAKKDSIKKLNSKALTIDLGIIF